MKGVIIVSLSSVEKIVCFPGQNSSCSVMNLLLLKHSEPIKHGRAVPGTGAVLWRQDLCAQTANVLWH